MIAENKPQATIGLALPWVNMMLDYTERVAAQIPDDLLGWRLSDPSGKWHFSLAEIAMHCADARRMFARQLSGSESTDGYWSDGPPTQEGIWSFRSFGSKQAVLDSLRSGREELRPYLSMPASAYVDVTEGTTRLFESALGQLREKGQDTTEVELRGPANIVRVLMAAIAHESGHRSSLQTLLRLHGINLKDE